MGSNDTITQESSAHRACAVIEAAACFQNIEDDVSFHLSDAAVNLWSSSTYTPTHLLCAISDKQNSICNSTMSRLYWTLPSSSMVNSSGLTHWQSGVHGPSSSPPARTGKTLADATTAAIATILARVIDMVRASVSYRVCVLVVVVVLFKAKESTCAETANTIFARCLFRRPFTLRSPALSYRRPRSRGP